MTVGNNKLIQRKGGLKLSKKEMTKLFWNKKGPEIAVWNDGVGNHVRMGKKKKSMKALENIRSKKDSLVFSGMGSAEMRFKSTKKKLTRDGIDFNLKRKSNRNIYDRKLDANPHNRSPDNRRKRKSQKKSSTLRRTKILKESGEVVRNKVSAVRKMGLELGSDIVIRRRVSGQKDSVLSSVKVEKHLGFADARSMLERKSLNSKSQKNMTLCNKIEFGKHSGRSKEKQYKRRQSEKSITLRTQGKSSKLIINRKKAKELEELVRAIKEARETRENSKSTKNRKHKKSIRISNDKTFKADLTKMEIWGLKSETKSKETSKRKALISDKKPKKKHKRKRLEQKIFKQLGEPNFQSLYKSQRRNGLRLLMDSQIEKTLTTNNYKSGTKKLLSKINFEVLAKKKSSKKRDIKSLTKMFKNKTAKSQNDERLLLFQHSKSIKKKSHFLNK